VKPIEQRRKGDGVWSGARDVADYDGDCIFAPGKLSDRSGCQWMIESMLECSVRIGKRRYIPTLNDGAIVVVRDYQVDGAFAKRECRIHFGASQCAEL